MASDVTAELVSALITHMRGQTDGWESLSMVIDLRDGLLAGTHGYTYGPGSVISATASRPSAVKSAVNAYTAHHLDNGQAMPLAMLVQFDRQSGRCDVTCEYHDANRWKVTPSNLYEIRELLRPAVD
ncbi:hypothetical protein C6401_11345 [Arthrobacter woluwensis]|uniref:hypothetical protein n=1 Tax=Arthrobacter woluwensis TaxID=156980 RepID=UPI000D13CBE6|nr:hypothetical protein [Arthrobacter woluwensis]PSS43706.1 hypothetical protein C6401_11345 [Arthrobacter woluwensis]